MTHRPVEALGRRSRIILLSPSGLGNEGDNAILQALSSRLSQRFENDRIVVATESPQDSANAIGVAAVPIMGNSRRGYAIRSFGVARPNRGIRHGCSLTHPNREALGGSDRLRELLKRVIPRRLRGVVTRSAKLLRGVPAEFRHISRTWHWLGRTRAVVVAGGGQLDELWGGPWAHPFAVATWAGLCRLRGVKFAFLGVGAGETEHFLTRAWLRLALSCADHVSVRDARSARVAAHLGRPQVVESRDLAFLLTNQQRRGGNPTSIGPQVTIAVSPMAFGRSESWPKVDMDAFTRLRGAISGACMQWLDSGYRIRFFVTSAMDQTTTREIMDDLRRSRPGLGSQVDFEPLNGLDEIMALLSESTVSVVARLHGVILSHIVGLPAVAVSHHWKVDEQLRMAGMGGFSFNPRTVTPEDLVLAVHSVLSDYVNVRSRISSFVEHCQDLVEADIDGFAHACGRSE